MNARTVLVALSSLVLAACAGMPATSWPVQSTLRPGDSTTLPDRTRLQYVGTRNDSRCPPQVQCFHAGDAEVHLRTERAGVAHDLVLLASTSSLDDGDLHIALVDLAFGDAPAATLRVDRR